MDELQKKAKRGIRMAVWAVVLFVSAFVSIFTGAFFDDGPYEYLCPVCLIVFFVLMVLCLVILIFGRTDILAFELVRLENKYKNKDMATISYCDRQTFASKIEKHGFRYVGSKDYCSFWEKKKFHFLKDTIQYCVYTTSLHPIRPVKVITEDVFSEMIDKNLDSFTEIDFLNKKLVLFMIFELEHTCKNELENLKKVCESQLVAETILTNQFEGALVPVVIDKESQKTYFFNEPKGITYYAYGCRMLKKIFL